MVVDLLWMGWSVAAAARSSAAAASSVDSTIYFSDIWRLVELLCFEIILIWYVLLNFVKFNFEAYLYSLFNLFCFVKYGRGKYGCELC